MMVHVLRDYYAFTDWRRIDWDALAAESRPAAQQPTALELQVAVNQLTASIPDSHVKHGPALGPLDYKSSFNGRCGQAAMAQFFALQDAQIGGGFGHTIESLDDESVVVTHVQPGSPAGRAGLKVGEVVSSLDGVPVQDAVNSLGVAGWIWAELNPATAQNRQAAQYRTVVHLL